MDYFDECIVCFENNLAQVRSDGFKWSKTSMLWINDMWIMLWWNDENISRCRQRIWLSLLPNSEKEAFERAPDKAKECLKWSQNLVGEDYYHGRGVTQSYPKAFEFFSLAEAQGNVIAQNFLGSMYGNGEGCKQSYKQAFNLFTLAAGHG